MAPTLPKKLLQHRPEAGDFDPQGRVAAGQYYVRQAQGNLLATQNKASQDMISTVGETAIDWIDSKQKAKYQQITDDLLNVTNRPDIASPKKYTTKSEEINAARKQYREQAEKLFSQGRFRDPGAIIPTHEDLLRKAGTSYAQQIGIEAKFSEAIATHKYRLEMYAADSTAQLQAIEPPTAENILTEDQYQQLTEMNPAAAIVVINSLSATNAERQRFGRRLAEYELRQANQVLENIRSNLRSGIHGLGAAKKADNLIESLAIWQESVDQIPAEFLSQPANHTITDKVNQVGREVVGYRRDAVWESIDTRILNFESDPVSKDLADWNTHLLDLITTYNTMPGQHTLEDAKKFQKAEQHIFDKVTQRFAVLNKEMAIELKRDLTLLDKTINPADTERRRKISQDLYNYMIRIAKERNQGGF
ncbi:MAG: hypothetical protein CL759_09285 [Chloroflexi bacterium]|nr:hypothetical protein [Chloroflexota bacterium]|tara:strand:- start:11640 stop:12899 length:1260 start_codon:yes stop_codon:yes gene_type:complete